MLLVRERIMDGRVLEYQVLPRRIQIGTPHAEGITLVMSARFCVNATRLALHSWASTGELSKIQYLLLVDDGSGTAYNAKLMQEAVLEHGNGEVVLLRYPGISCGGVLDMLAQGEFLQTKMVLFCDNDVCMLRDGLVETLLRQFDTPGVVGAGHYLPYRIHHGVTHLPGWAGDWRCPPLMSTICSLWLTDVWREAAREIGCNAHREDGPRLLYDGFGLLTKVVLQQGKQLVAVDIDPFLKHFGAVTWGRQGPHKEPQDRYQVITGLLRARGVSECLLHEDRPYAAT